MRYVSASRVPVQAIDAGAHSVCTADAVAAPLFSSIACAFALALTAPAEERVHFRGNLVIPDEVYLAVLDLPRAAPINAQTVATSQAKVLAFLRRAGYELATVKVTA